MEWLETTGNNLKWLDIAGIAGNIWTLQEIAGMNRLCLKSVELAGKF